MDAGPEHARSIPAFLFLAAFHLHAANPVAARNFYAEPPTLISLGFEWQIEGDDNRNASVAVSWQKRGDTAWKEGLPLLRIGNEILNENAIQFTTPNMFAGSIFDLGRTPNMSAASSYRIPTAQPARPGTS